MNESFLIRMLRKLLIPFSLLYGLVTWARNKAYDAGYFSSKSFDLPIIAVGNLSVGGTGKTPMVAYLINLLKEKGPIAVLSRGYKRKSKGFLLADSNTTALELGDEPFLLFKKFPQIMMAVDENRVKGVQELLKNKQKPAVILLDDAFQHRKIKAQKYILLTSYDQLYINDCLLPTGNLREGRYAAKRADVIVVTKCPEQLSEAKKSEIIKKLHPLQNQQVFFSSIHYNQQLYGEGNALTINDLKSYKLVLVTGIAQPKPLLDYLNSQSVHYTHLKYADHHQFDKNDLAAIQNRFDQIKTQNKLILTTEKDYVRLEGKLDNLYYIGIDTVMDGTGFNAIVLNSIN